MWIELCMELKADKFKAENPDLEEDDLWDKFYKEVTSKHFEHGEYGSLEIEVDENFNIVGGKIL